MLTPMLVTLVITGDTGEFNTVAALLGLVVKGSLSKGSKKINSFFPYQYHGETHQLISHRLPRQVSGKNIFLQRNLKIM